MSFFCLQSHLKTLILLFLALGRFITLANNHDSIPNPLSRTASTARVFSLPMQFEPNAGQTDSQVRFLSRGPGYTIFLTPTEAVFSLRSVSNSPSGQLSHHSGHRSVPQVTETVVRMTLRGANPASRIEAPNDDL